jgi:hypothetical protein
MMHESASRCETAAAPPSTTALSRPQLLGLTLLGLLFALSVLTAVFVLHLMSASAAAATGGCGGG